MLDAAGPKALGARLLLRSLVTHCSQAGGCHGRAIGWLGDSVAAVPDRFGRTAGSRWVRTSAGAVVGWQGASRAAGGLPDPEGGDQAAPFTIAAGRSRRFRCPRSKTSPGPPSSTRRPHGGLPPGLQTGIALFSCLVSARVDPALWHGPRQGSSSNSPSWRGRLPPPPGVSWALSGARGFWGAAAHHACDAS